MNIINLIKEQLGGDVIDKISSYIGEDESRIRTAVNAAVPALLAGMSKMASTNDGARRLSDLFSGFTDRGPSAGFGIGSDTESEGFLGSLLRDGPLSGIINNLTRVSGLGSGTMRKIVAFITPIVLGTITRSFGKAGATADSVSRFFAEQKTNIMDALPAGLSLDDAYSSVTRQGARAVRNVQEAVGVSRSPSYGWPLALTTALLLGLGVWYLASLARNKTRVAPAPVAERRVNDQTRVQTVRDTVPVPSDVSDSLHGAVQPLYETLRQIDSPSALSDALPRLRDASDRLEQVRQRFDVLSMTRRDSIREAISGRISSVKEEITRILEMPNLSEEAHRILRQLSDRVAGFARQ